MKQYILGYLNDKLTNSYLIIGGGSHFYTDVIDDYYFKGWFSIIMWLNSFGINQYIVSGYNNYEWIDTYTGKFMLPFKWEARRKWGKGYYTVKKRDMSKDNEILHHSPYDNI